MFENWFWCKTNSWYVTKSVGAVSLNNFIKCWPRRRLKQWYHFRPDWPTGTLRVDFTKSSQNFTKTVVVVVRFCALLFVDVDHQICHKKRQQNLVWLLLHLKPTVGTVHKWRYINLKIFWLPSLLCHALLPWAFWPKVTLFLTPLLLQRLQSWQEHSPRFEFVFFFNVIVWLNVFIIYGY